VITVTAPRTGSTTAQLQAWTRSGSGWLRSGATVPAFLGSNGMSPNTHEGLAATPMGSFTLTQAFGREPNPGARLPYRQTTPADWWISQPGRFYNTWQHCAGDCPFTQGDPNEHLYEITPWYDYAVVIDYNRDPVRPGAGSGFFLHVSVGEPTAGCVAVPRAEKIRLLSWLDPAAHPRILIGTG
jgi:L,D-peptidoglycan transpeptidase YkuD (ErfK/YbiS/YcfS/YnhG family)